MPSLEREAYSFEALSTMPTPSSSASARACQARRVQPLQPRRHGARRNDGLQQAFGFKSLFDGFYHLYPSLEQRWAYYARYIDFMLREPTSQPLSRPTVLIA